jgi:hypothetical protein
LFLGLYGSGAVCPVIDTVFSFFSVVAAAMKNNFIPQKYRERFYLANGW